MGKRADRRVLKKVLHRAVSVPPDENGCRAWSGVLHGGVPWIWDTYLEEGGCRADVLLLAAKSWGEIGDYEPVHTCGNPLCVEPTHLRAPEN